MAMKMATVGDVYNETRMTLNLLYSSKSMLN